MRGGYLIRNRLLPEFDELTLGILFFPLPYLRCRTGTKSLNEALTILLNGPVHDAGIQSLGGSNHQVKRWLQIMRRAPDAKTLSQKKYLQFLLADILDGYVATVDVPAATLTPELMDLYPDAVVIASTRDEESWWKSMNHVNDMMSTWYLPLVVMWVPKASVYGRWRGLLGYLAVWRYDSHQIKKDTLKKHEDHLREVVPPEKLFWYNVKDGWEPLCKILDVPVPDRPFPHNNSKVDASKVYRDVIFLGVICWILALSFFFIVVPLIWGILPRRTELTSALLSGIRDKPSLTYSNGTCNC